MNFGVNLYNWFLTNAQSLVLMAIVVIGIYLGFKREFIQSGYGTGCKVGGTAAAGTACGGFDCTQADGDDRIQFGCGTS